MPEMAVRDHSLSAALYLCRKRTDVEGELGTGEEVIRLLRAGSVGVQVRIRHLTRASPKKVEGQSAAFTVNDPRNTASSTPPNALTDMSLVAVNPYDEGVEGDELWHTKEREVAGLQAVSSETRGYSAKYRMSKCCSPSRLYHNKLSPCMSSIVYW
jgi:hypothetical protein